MSARELKAWVVTTVTLVGVLFALSCVAAAHAQAAIPAVQSGGDGLWGWLQANWQWMAPLVIALLSSLVTGLSDYPRAGGAVRVLRIVIGCLSVVSFRNSPGSLKAPLMPPEPPARPTPPPVPKE